MKTRNHFLRFAFFILSAAILLTGCTKIGFIVERLDNAAFVRNAASLVNDHKEISEWLYAGDNILVDLEQNL